MRCLLKKENVIGILLVSVLGTLLHFAYDWSGNNFFVGLLTPVNESTWEHLKLLFFPMLLYTVILSAAFPGNAQKKSALYAGTLAGIALITTLFYTYSGILGFNTPAVDIPIFYIAVLAAFYISCRLEEGGRIERYEVPLTLLVLLVAILFLIFTVSPPSLGLFASPG